MTLSDIFLENFQNLEIYLNEIFLPSKDDYETKTDVDSYKKSMQQKLNWKKHRHKIMTGIDRNARNNYKQGIYTKEKTSDSDTYKSGFYEK